MRSLRRRPSLPDRVHRVDPPAAVPATPPLPNSYWLIPGRVLAGEHPGGASAEVTRERLGKLLGAGIDSFIDLTHKRELPAYEKLLPDGIEYLRRPIPDHGVLSDPKDMAALLAHIADRLRAGRLLYVHCRAGIGRTGTVAGCLLAERGLTGEEALLELNRRWQQCARSARWQTIPETYEQNEFVRNWRRTEAPSDPLLEPSTLAAARGLRGRFQGALLGLAAGDAVAAATQFKKPGRFTPLGDLLGGGPFDLPRGAWSDETAMALLVADSLIEREGFDAADQVERYRRWQQEGYLSATGQCLGITGGTARALAMAQWRRQPFSGTHDPAAQEADALARVVPVVMYFFGDAAAVQSYAAQAARTTCQAAPVLESCRALAAGLHAALSGKAKAASISAVQQLLPPASGGKTPAALAAALEVFGGTHNYRDAVVAAANLGGDSDVVGAACGALAGAHYTASAVPTLWHNSLMKLELLESTADRLLAHALLGLGN
jgi:ADP-ribosyl-[dinitrogen reductase] hydrolase